MSDLLKLVEQSIAKRHLFAPCEKIMIAVSGGVDSMVLLHLLAQLAPAHQWQLTVVHFNHQLRGRSSDADERLVERTAKKLGLAFVADRADVKKFARQNKVSIEMAARELRHQFFARVAARHRIKKIALAHHADDQVELFFLRLLRGAGGEGIAGMKWLAPSPVNPKISLVRPLLDQPKALLAAFAKGQGITFREDATNDHVDILRNRIRHKLLPRLVTDFQPVLSRVVLRQMEIAGAEADFVTQTAQAWLNAKRRQPFFNLPVAIQRRCLQLQLVQLNLATHFDLIEQLRERVNQPITVSPRATVHRDSLGHVKIKTATIANFHRWQAEAHLQGRAGELTRKDLQIFWAIQPAPAGPFHLPKKQVNSETFDADKVGVDIVLRHWRRGDRFQPLGLAAPVKLQDLFINAKIPREQRHRLLVCTTAKGVLFWVEGLRFGESFKLDKNTRYQLNWRWKRLC